MKTKTKSTQYVLTFFGQPQCHMPADGQKYMTQWQAWVKGMGKAVVNPCTPFGKRKFIASPGNGPDAGCAGQASGFAIITAPNLAAAARLAKKCPHLQFGPIEVAEAVQMDC